MPSLNTQPPRPAPRSLKPASVLAAGRPHGDRLRYIGGCRCDDCRRANTAYEKARAIARKAGDWNGVVSADRARAHMVALARQGVGRRAVAAASDIAETILCTIRSGARKQIRARTERKILAVTPAAASDRAITDAGPTWKLIAELVAAGFTKRAIGRKLGQHGSGLQLGRTRITVRNADRVKRIHAELMASGAALVSARATWKLIAELRHEGYTEKQLARHLDFDNGELQIPPTRVSTQLAQRVADLHRRLTA